MLIENTAIDILALGPFHKLRACNIHCFSWHPKNHKCINQVIRKRVMRTTNSLETPSLNVTHAPWDGASSCWKHIPFQTFPGILFRISGKTFWIKTIYLRASSGDSNMYDPSKLYATTPVHALTVERCCTAHGRFHCVFWFMKILLLVRIGPLQRRSQVC